MRRTRLAALLIGFVVVFGACAQEDPTVEAPEDIVEETSEATSPADSEAATVAVADSDFGDILVNAEGATLYVFLKDTDGDSTCKDACAQTWPPLTTEGEPAAGDGVDEEMLGTTERDDGDSQVTYDDRPLYTYAADSAEGDTKGQGVGGNWYVVGPDGEPIKK